MASNGPWAKRRVSRRITPTASLTSRQNRKSWLADDYGHRHQETARKKERHAPGNKNEAPRNCESRSGIAATRSGPGRLIARRTGAAIASGAFDGGGLCG